MKTTYVLTESIEIDATAFAINSHEKDYKLCWHINKGLSAFLIKEREPKQISKKTFTIFTSKHDGRQLSLIKNQSKDGFLMPQKKNIDYFMTIKPRLNSHNKEQFVQKLNRVSKILLTFEIDLNTEPEAHRLMFND